MGARNFTGNTQYIVGSVGVAACPAAFAAWYQPLNVATGQETLIGCRNLVSGRGARNFGVWSLDSSAKVVLSGVNNNGNLFTARGTIMPIAQWNSTIVGSGLCIFIAATSSDGGANWVFYYRFSADAALTNPTSTDNGGVACPGGTLYAGAAWDDPTIINSCLGKLGQIGVWNVALTADQLLAWSLGTDIALANAYCAMPIVGTDPELNDGTLGSNVMDVVGDPDFTEISCVPNSTPVPPGNPPLVSPNLPHISGGPGGGLGIPTLSWDDGGPTSLSPTVGNARMVQSPDWGGMGIKGSRGGRKGGLLAQRQAGMYRGLDHLASKLRGKRK